MVRQVDSGAVIAKPDEQRTLITLISLLVAAASADRKSEGKVTTDLSHPVEMFIANLHSKPATIGNLAGMVLSAELKKGDVSRNMIPGDVQIHISALMAKYLFAVGVTPDELSTLHTAVLDYIKNLGVTLSEDNKLLPFSTQFERNILLYILLCDSL